MKNIIIFLVLLSVLFLNFSCTNRNENTKIVSPSGKYSLDTSINHNKADMRKYLCIVITIYDEMGKIIETIQTSASNRMKWDVSWDAEDNILLNSSDIGSCKWEKVSSKRWELRRLNADESLVIKLDFLEDIPGYNVNLLAESIGGMIYTVCEPSDATIKQIDGKDFYCYDLSTLATNFKKTNLKLYLHKNEGNGDIIIKFEGFKDYYLTWNPIEKYKPLQDVMFYNEMILLDSSIDEIDLSLTGSN